MSTVAGGVLRLALRGTQRQVRHVRPAPAGRSGNPDADLVAAVYDQLERDFGMLAPPVTLHSPAPPVLAASWSMLRETLLADGLAGRPAKEAVATAVSRSNTCPYCVEVHGATLDTLAGGGPEGVNRAAGGWAERARTRNGAAAHPLPLPAEQAPELLGVAATFHYLNRMVNVFLGPSPFPAGLPARARRQARKALGRVAVPRGGRPVPPGRSLHLLPAAPLPADLRWATGAPTVAAAFARASTVIEAAGRAAVPPAVRDKVRSELDEWTGAPPGPSRAWVQPAVAELSLEDRPAGRLALLTALASYQVDDRVVADYRAGNPDDRTLIEITAWASLAAARRLAQWAGAASHR